MNKMYIYSMHIKVAAVTFILCLLSIACMDAQQLDDFTGLKSSGKIPKQITTNSSQTYKVLKTSTDVSKEGLRKRKRSNKFQLESTFAIDEMMRTGWVLFNEPLSEYVGQVADKLLKPDPATRKQLNFYVARSPQFNAFATDRGDIFINVGLLTYLETEAQLAFILAHEITHWAEKHSMDAFMEFEGIDSDRGYKKKNDFTKILRKSNYSKKIEEEADAEGIKLFFRSSYGTGSLENIFDMMASAHTPYTNEVFDLSYLNINDLSLSDTLLLESVNPIKTYDEDHKLSTHPGTKKRKDALQQAVKKVSISADRPDFIVGEKKFNEIKKLAQFEVCKISIEQLDYYDALYYSSLLSKVHPDNAFLAAVKAKALYGVAKMANEIDASTMQELGDSIQGEIQQVYHVMGNFLDIELQSLTAAHLWDFHQKYPDDEGMKLRLTDILMDMYEGSKSQMDELYGIKKESDLKTAGILSGLAANEAFNEMLKSERPEAPLLSHSKLEKGYRLGLKKVTFINPYYLSVNLRKSKAPIQFIDTENKQERMVDAIKKRARRLKLNTKVMDVHSLTRSAKAEKFNHIITLERWMQQKLFLPDGMIPDNHNEAVEVMKKNKTGDHLAFMGGLSLKAKKSGAQITGNVLATLTGLFAPYGIAKLAKPNNKTMYYTVVVDTDTQNVIMSSYNAMPQRDMDTIMNANIHWFLLQMKKKPRK